jgi:phage tail-like protein
MADDGAQQPITASPPTSFRFEVRWDRQVMSFQEVSGLDVDTQPIEYRHGDRAGFAPVKMPGLKKFGNVTMKKGVLKGEKFWDWFNQIKMNQASRVPLVISLLDEGGRPTMVWTLSAALPAKATGVVLNAAGNEVAVESLEIAHEGISISNA